MKNILLTLEAIEYLRRKLNVAFANDSFEEQQKILAAICTLQRSCEDYTRDNIRALDYANLCM